MRGSEVSGSLYMFGYECSLLFYTPLLLRPCVLGTDVLSVALRESGLFTHGFA